MIHAQEKIEEIFSKYEEEMQEIIEKKQYLDKKYALMLESIPDNGRMAAEIFKSENLGGWTVNYFESAEDIGGDPIKQVIYPDVYERKEEDEE